MFPLFIFSGAFSVLFLSMDKYLEQSGQKTDNNNKGRERERGDGGRNREGQGQGEKLRERVK